jgi:hypothetical protein
MTTEERLERVEKELARAKRQNRVLLVAAVIIVSVVFLLGASENRSRDTIRAKAFCVVDENDSTRAALGLSGDGQPVLNLYDGNGTRRVRLGLGGGCPGLWLYDENDTVRTVLSLCESGQPGLAMAGENGTPLVDLGVGSTGKPGLGMYDENNTLRSVLGFSTTGQPVLDLYDENGKTIWNAH